MIIAKHKEIKIDQTHREDGSLWVILEGGLMAPLAMNYDEDGVKYAYIYDNAEGEVRFEMLSPEEWDAAESSALD